jgi:hypothetical protein
MEQPKKLLDCWTAEHYQGHEPPFVNVTQIGSAVQIIIRGPNAKGESESMLMLVNMATAWRIGETILDAAKKYDVNLNETFKY